MRPMTVSILSLSLVLALSACDDDEPIIPSEVGLTALQRLGKRLFEDTNLSEPAGQSCASCHNQDAHFTDPDQDVATSQGVHADRFGNRNTPTAGYMAFSPVFHWDETEGLYLGGQFVDGRSPTLEDQARHPFLNPVEMANANEAAVVAKVRKASYATLFNQVFGLGSLDDDRLAYNKIAEAIAAFERAERFAPFSSKFDAWKAGKANLTAQELRGLAVFEAEDKGNCAACHPSKPAQGVGKALFTDFSYDNLGVPRNPDNSFYTLPAQFNPDGRDFVDLGLGGALAKNGVANAEAENGKMKVPTLRNIARTAPYMHNGYFKDLRAVVEFYNDRDIRPRCANDLWTREAEAQAQRCWPAPESGQNVNTDELGRLGLTPREIDDIVVFLHTLTDGYLPDAP